MKRVLILSIVILGCFANLSNAHAADRYLFDKAHTKIVFFVKHLGFSNFMGNFTQFGGAFHFSEEHPERSTVDVTIDPAGIRTDSPELDTQLKAEDMFDIEHFPHVHFKSTSVHISGINKGTVTGDLTIKTITRPVTLNVTFNKCGTHPLTKQYICGFSASTGFSRAAFGLNAWKGFVGDHVKLHLEVEGFNEWRTRAKMKRNS